MAFFPPIPLIRRSLIIKKEGLRSDIGLSSQDVDRSRCNYPHRFKRTTDDEIFIQQKIPDGISVGDRFILSN